MKKEQKAAATHVRVGPAVKAAAVRLAHEDGRSLANRLERPIETEAARLDNEKVKGKRGGLAARSISPGYLLESIDDRLPPLFSRQSASVEIRESLLHRLAEPQLRLSSRIPHA